MRALLAALLLCLIASEAIADSGIASVYTVASNGGRHTASGVPFRNDLMTAAHKTINFGTKVRVTNRRNGRSVVVVITDRGPFINGRIIDLSMAAASAIGMGYGLAPVTLEVVGCVPRLTGASLAGC